MKTTQQQRSQQPLTVPDSRQFVTCPEVARVLGRCESGVRALFNSGHLPGKKVGNRWLMHRDDFARLIAPPPPITIQGASVHTETLIPPGGPMSDARDPEPVCTICGLVQCVRDRAWPPFVE